MPIIIILLLTLVCYCNPIMAESQYLNRYLGQHLEHFSTDDSDLTAEQVLLNHRHEFVIGDEPVYNYGFSSQHHWIKIPKKILSELSSYKNLYVEIDFPLINQVDIYYFKDFEIYAHELTGTEYLFKQRPINAKNFSFFLKPEVTNQNVYPDTILIKLSASNALFVPIHILQQQEYTDAEATYGYWWGAYFGVMLFIATYNLVIFFSLKEKSYIYYVLYIVFGLLMIASLNGHGFAYLWPSIPYVNKFSITVSTTLMIFFAIHFTRHYISLYKLSTRLDHIFKWMAKLALGLCIFSVFAPFDCSMLAALLASFFGPLMIYAAVLATLKRVAAAQYFLVAWLIYLTGVTAYALMVLKILPANILTIHLKEVGALLDVLLLSFGLAAKIKYFQKTANDAMRVTVDVLSEANRLKDEFLMTMSHELRTPINGVLGTFELLKGQEFSDQVTEQIHIGQASTQKMLSLIEQLLQLSEIKSGNVSEVVEPFNLRYLVENICKEKSEIAAAKNIKFRPLINPNIPEGLSGDQRKVETIINHLLDNAIKFTLEGEVMISTEYEEMQQDDIRIIIKVTDTGIGISEKFYRKIFKPFQQVDSNMRRNFQGCGVGLSISLAFAKCMHGDIKVESVEGEGSTFIFSFNIKKLENNDLLKNEKSEKETYCEDEQTGYIEKPIILIVEDEMTNQIIMKSFLKKMGYEFLLASNGAQGVDAVKNNHVDVVLMDCQMPVMDGLEATRVIRELEKNNIVSYVPIIAVTANCMTKDRIAAELAGMDDFLEKPVKMERLKEKIDQYLIRQSVKKDTDKNSDAKNIDAETMNLNKEKNIVSFYDKKNKKSQ